MALVVALLAGALASVLGVTAAGADSTASVANTTRIAIPDEGSANPFPSAITASGLGSTITGLQVVLRGVSHTCVKDLDILLVGPSGTKTTLISDNGHVAVSTGCDDLVKNTVTISDACATFGTSIPSGADICVRPSDNDAFGHQGDNWPGVGEEFPALNLSTFNGTNPNGVWKLYVRDDSGGDSGALNGGWGLKITTANTAPTAQPQVLDVNKGVTAPFTVTGTDPDGGPLTCQVPSATASGKGTLGGSGCARSFTAAPRTAGTDRVTVRLTDNTGAQSGPADVVFNIVNRLPVAEDQTLTVGRGQRIAIALGGTDPDPGESFALTCQPTIGTTGRGSVSGSGCNVTYQAGQTNGADSFPFIVSDGLGGTEAGTVSIVVGDPTLPGCPPGDTKNARYICRVYLDLLNRTAEPGGKAFWLRKIDAGGDRVKIIQQFQNSTEYRRTVVDDIYRTFLDRPADPSGLSFWTEQIRRGANPDRVRARVIGSNEFYNRAGASSASFGAALYQQTLRRPATNGELAQVAARLGAGTSREGLAAELLATREGDVATVANIYERYLRRTPQAGETFWVNRLQAGVTELKMVESIVASNEYFNLA